MGTRWWGGAGLPRGCHRPCMVGLARRLGPKPVGGLSCSPGLTVLGVVIGKAGKDIAKGEAWGHVFGFTVCNDLTDRQVQKRHQQWFLGKSGDGMLPLGPVVVPKGRMPGKIELTTTVNGELRQHCASCLDTLIFDVPELLATISRSITLEVGDVIATGTPKGVGAGFKPPKFLAPGDRVDVTVGGIGKLTTYIV